MKVQETNEMQNAQSIGSSGFVKLYARGKIGLLFQGDKRFTDIARQCFARAILMTIRFDRQKFELEMRKHGIPDDAIKKFAEGYALEDDLWLSEYNNWPS